MKWTCHVTSIEYILHKRNVFMLDNLEEQDHLQCLGVDGSQYESDPKNVIWKIWTGFIWLRALVSALMNLRVP
jgi:hypothetical protein